METLKEQKRMKKLECANYVAQMAHTPRGMSDGKLVSDVTGNLKREQKHYMYNTGVQK